MVDWQRIEALKSEIGPDDFNEVLEMFVSELDEVLGQLGEDVDQMVPAETFHFLKSGALNIGFAEFAGLCQRGEKSALNGSAVVSASDLIETYTRSKAAYFKVASS